MSNIIATNSWTKSIEEQKYYEMVPVLYIYGDNVEDLCGLHSDIDHLELASIKVLRREIEEERDGLETGFNKYGEEIEYDQIVPWDGLLICKEGMFKWNWETENYELNGKIIKT